MTTTARRSLPGIHPTLYSPMTESTRQLPGVKGQWILCSQCSPTEADTDADGEVRVYVPGYAWVTEHRKPAGLKRSDYWCPADYLDTRPFTLPAAPAPATSTERRFVQLTSSADDSVLLAIADDGTAWWARCNGPWQQLDPLPPREA